jgi:LacI family transcriptional regulator
MQEKQTTIKDIAKQLGVSKSTVSRALKDHPDISQKTKDAVKEIATRLKYRPNAIAYSLRHKQSKVIGLIVPQISFFFLPSVVRGIEEVVHQNGYNLLILQSNESYQREVENLDILISNNIEGILVSVSRETTDYSHFQRVIELNIPIVFYDRVVKNMDTDIVLLDDITASYNAVSHLLDKGRSKIAICTGNMNLLISRNRVEGYKQALIDRKIPINQDYIISCEWPEEAMQKTIQLLESDHPPDGIFAISDLTVSGVMKGINAKNLSIPKDIAVVGFSEEPFRSMYTPPLTAIQPMGQEIGKTSAEILFQRIKINKLGKPKPRLIYIDGQLIAGGSA